MPQIIEGEDGVERVMIDGELYPAKKMIDIDGASFKEKGYFSMTEENTSESVAIDAPKEPTVADKAADMYDQMEKEHQRLLNMVKDAISHSILSASNNALQYSKHGKPWIKRQIKIFNLFNENMNELTQDFQYASELATYLTENWKYLKKLCKSNNIDIKCLREHDPINFPAHIDENDIMTIKVYPNKRKMDNMKTTTLKGQLESMVDDDVDTKILVIICKRICKYCENNIYQNASILYSPDSVYIHIPLGELIDGFNWDNDNLNWKDIDWKTTSLKYSRIAKEVFTRSDFMDAFISKYKDELFAYCVSEGLFVYFGSEYEALYVYAKPKWYSYIKYPWLRAFMKNHSYDLQEMPDIDYRKYP